MDDAHGAGTLGRTGREPRSVRCGDQRIVQTISLSKAFGVYGGAVLGTAKVIEAIVERSRIFNGNRRCRCRSNAALASVRILKRDGRCASGSMRTWRESTRHCAMERGPPSPARVNVSPNKHADSAVRAPLGESSPLVTFTPRDRAACRARHNVYCALESSRR